MNKSQSLVSPFRSLGFVSRGPTMPLVLSRLRFVRGKIGGPGMLLNIYSRIHGIDVYIYIYIHFFIYRAHNMQ